MKFFEKYLTSYKIITEFSTLLFTFCHIPSLSYCYELKSLELDKRTNSCIGVSTRELDREPFIDREPFTK